MRCNYSSKVWARLVRYAAVSSFVPVMHFAIELDTIESMVTLLKIILSFLAILLLSFQMATHWSTVIVFSSALS